MVIVVHIKHKGSVWILLLVKAEYNVFTLLIFNHKHDLSLTSTKVLLLVLSITTGKTLDVNTHILHGVKAVSFVRPLSTLTDTIQLACINGVLPTFENVAAKHYSGNN